MSEFRFHLYDLLYCREKCSTVYNSYRWPWETVDVWLTVLRGSNAVRVRNNANHLPSLQRAKLSRDVINYVIGSASAAAPTIHHSASTTSRTLKYDTAPAISAITATFHRGLSISPNNITEPSNYILQNVTENLPLSYATVPFSLSFGTNTALRYIFIWLIVSHSILYFISIHCILSWIVLFAYIGYICDFGLYHCVL